MSNEKASIVCFEQFIEAFLTESSKSPALIANIRLTFRFYEKKPHPRSLTLRDTAYILTTESVIITFQFYHYMSVRFFSLTDCLYIAVALQRRMDDSSLV